MQENDLTHFMIIRLFVILSICLGSTTIGLAQPPELTLDNLPAWRDHILPGEDDLAWQQIPWLTTYAEGILAADRSDKPLLLWTMNGHPLGCT